ncbi:MAG: lamin tail domain-containing protein [Verrucomicrobiae bacterium]|nr:lamin tail domain-containing protein [Verrucomicrobiae bacterium]
MVGEPHSGADARDHSRGNETRSRLKTALKIFFWFSVMCLGLISLVGFYAYKRFQNYHANQSRYEQQFSPMPSEPVDIFVESDEPESPDLPSIDNEMPSNNEAAPASAELTGQHATARAAAGIVINEINFHPQSSWDMPEDTRQEFIELHNAGRSDVSLEGYKLKKGVKFTFPAFDLLAGGYVVIAADPQVFREQHPDVQAVLGSWKGTLSNSGEEIELEDADGKKVDAVRYSDGGDWAMRQPGSASRGNQYQYQSNRSIFSSDNSNRYRSGTTGWEWKNDADGEGFSLELRSAAVSNQNGQNWHSSTERGGTPGRQNSVYSPDIAPVISDTKHRPVIPTPSDSVTISATIKDELDTGIRAELYWRVSGAGSASFKTETMAADGKLYSARIPPQQDGAIVEFFIRTTDEGKHSRTWPAVTDMGQAANALYQVEAQPDEPAPGYGLYRLVMTQQDNQKFQRMNRHTDAEVNATLIADDGDGPIVRYNCGVRYRGAGSRDHYPTPMRVNLPSDQPWHGVTKMNLNSKYSWLQFAGMKIFADAGERAPDAKPVTVRTNGQDLMMQGGRRNGGDIKSSTETDYGYYVHLEPLGAEWVKNHFPEDDKGNAYKKVRPDNDWAYRRGSARAYLSDGWSKSSNAAAADWSDLDNLLRVMNYAPRDNDYLEQVQRVADLGQWYRWFGVNALLANGEGGLARGIDDDYGLYRGVEDPRFKILPHDMDTILARGDRSRIRDAYNTLFDFAEDGDEIEPLEILFDHEKIRRDYLVQIHDLLTTTFAPGHFDALVENNLGGWVPDGDLRQISTWMASRRAFAASEVEHMLGPNAATPRHAETLGSLDSPSTADLELSEVFAAGTGDVGDFIEIHNRSDAAADISGYRLTDNEKKPDKYAIPEGTVIAPGGYHIVTEKECGFGLEASGESVLLFAREGDSPVDSIAFGLQITGYSIGRSTDQGHSWTLNQPTPGAPNMAQSLGDPAQLCINEWLVHPDLLFETDFVELFNKNALPVALGGLRITDDPFNYPARFETPALSFIGGNSFTMFKAVGSSEATEGNARELPMKFAYEHGYINISGSNGVRIDQINYQCHRRDISQGRSQDGGAKFAYFKQPTPGTSNTAPPQDANGGNGSLAESLRISEIMFHPIGGSELEFVELTNSGTSTLSLKGVRFTLGIDFEFKADTELAPGACAVIAADAIAFAAEYGEEIPVAGEFKGKLSNKGDTLQLKLPKPSETLILSIDYKDKWQPDADGLGKSLVLKDARLSRQACANADAWKASAEDRGSPGRLE